MEDSKSPETVEQNYPSVDLAYDITLKSYDWAIQRYDAIDNTIDKLLGWISSITLGVIAIVATKEPQPNFQDCAFYVAMFFFGITVVSGVATKVWGSLSLINPQDVYNKYLTLVKSDFKKKVVFFGGKAFKRNQTIVNHKGKVSILMIGCFIGEMVAIGYWLIP